MKNEKRKSSTEGTEMGDTENTEKEKLRIFFLSVSSV
jgi:hypothetical protein